MWTTGLVSLSIHEALTFDGIEIALHPDLFSDQTSMRQNHVGRPSLGSATVTSSAATALQKPQHIRINSDSGALLQGAEGPKAEDGRTPILPAASFTSAQSAPNRRLELGDMIEIRVWDPLPGGSDESSPKGSKLRRSPAASKDSSRGGSGSSSVMNEGSSHLRRKSSTNLTLEAAASSLQQSKVSSTASLQYSVDSSSIPTSDKNEDLSSKEGDTSSVSSIERTKEAFGLSNPSSPKETVPKTVTASPDDDNRGGMPPTFPRARSETTDGVASRLMASKPPPLQRSRTGTPMHSRELSDMTVDTILGSSILPQPTESGDDDDDYTLSRIASTHTLRLSLVMLVTEKTLTSLKESARTQVSMLRQVADLYNLSSYDMVTVNRIKKSEEETVVKAVSADFVTVTIKDQYISRGDMYFFQKSLLGRWIYEGQRLGNSTKGVQAHAREIRHEKRLAKSGIVTDETMITFRSRSARIFWLVQISSEMWDYASPYGSSGNEENSCDIYFDKFVTFMHRLFEKWQELEVTHSLTVVFFSRTYLSGKERGAGDSKSAGINVDVFGRLYEDHFKMVIENGTTADWDSLIVQIKREFVRYPFDVGWNFSDQDGRRPSTAVQGNILEAVNVTLNLMQFHYLDRDLHRVGNSIVIVSPGCGVFEVDRDLAEITYQRMMDNGIGSDMLSLGLPPLHTAPFFHYNNDLFAVDTQGVDTDKRYHEIPHWMHLSFFAYDSEASPQGCGGPSSETKGSYVANASLHASMHEIEVAPNGFYIPNLKTEDENELTLLSARRASFSAQANVAASSSTASKSKNRQRQLVSERAFEDILEACRPRNTRHSAPAALSSILRMYKTIEKDKHERLVDTEKNTTAKKENMHEPENSRQDDVRKPKTRLQEWGSIDPDEIGAIVLKPSTTVGKACPQAVSTTLPRDKGSDRSASPSPSSLSSQLSNLLSRSFEQGLSIHNNIAGSQFHSRPPVAGIQMQRSPSMNSLVVVAGDAEEAHSSTGKKSDGSCESLGIEFKSSVDKGQNVSSNGLARNGVDRLRDMMKRQDKQFFMSDQVKADSQKALLMDSSVTSGHNGTLRRTLPGSKTTTAPRQPVEGLGAALQSYKTSRHGAAPVSAESKDIKRNKGSSRRRETGQLRSTFVLSRSLGPLQGTPPSSQLRAAMNIPSRGPDSLEDRVFSRGRSQGTTAIARRSTSIGLSLVAASPPGRSQVFGRRSTASAAASTVATSPPQSLASSQKARSPPSEQEGSPSKWSVSSKNSKRKQHTLNPFKQQDEDAVLAEKSHNRRRWSHVFPLGEVEFKRHTGPNWKSLSQPAILPLTIDYYPPPQELNKFLIRSWDIPLDGIERGNYKSHSELMMTMVTQRLTQDYQVVPPLIVQESRRRAEAAAQLVAQDRGSRIRKDPFQSPPAQSLAHMLKPPGANRHSPPNGEPTKEAETIELNLSMGHTIHILKYDPNAEEKKIIVNQLSRQRKDKVFQYSYLVYSPTRKKYVKNFQQFHEFSNEYRWNQVDHLIGGIEDKKRSAEMKFRQVMFALIPEHFADKTAEQNYIDKFRKLLDYINKLRERDESDALDVQILSSDDVRMDPRNEVSTVRREATDTMKRVTVQLRKGKSDPYEWLDIAVEPTFDTRRSYRVWFEWLVASSSKVDSQIQLFLRRGSQYGLKVVGIPQVSISPTIFLNPLHATSIFCIRDRGNADCVDEAILARDFVDDGIHMTERGFLECIDDPDYYHFGMRKRRIPARQFVHRSGSLFVRLLRDEKALVILAAIENRKLVGRDRDMLQTARSALLQIEAYCNSQPSANSIQQSFPDR